VGLILDSSLLIANERGQFSVSAWLGPHDLIIAATAMHRGWAVATFNAAEFRHIPDLEVIEPD